MKIKTTVILFVAIALVLSSLNIFGFTPKAKAEEFNNNKYIGFSQKYYNSDVIISSGTTVLDGDHTFSNLTIRNGATLTHSYVNDEGKVGGNDDFFAIRWKGFIELPSTVTNLVAESDDDVKIGVKKMPSGSWHWTSFGQWESIDFYNNNDLKGGGLYQIEIDYKANTGSEHVKLTYGNNYSNRPITGGMLFINENKISGTCGTEPGITGINGLCGEYYSFLDRASIDIPNPPADPFENYSVEMLTKIDPQNITDNFDFSWDNGVSPFPTTSIGGLRLTITGTLTIEGGGKIDVSGKGYPGGKRGSVEEHGEPGWGPAGGHYADSWNDENGSDGGGFGGKGGQGKIVIDRQNGVPPQATYGNQSDPINLTTTLNDWKGNSVPVIFGSGGGYARNRYHDGESPGGNGGGSVKIKAVNINIDNNVNSQIVANGNVGKDEGRARSGSGSGGSIVIECDNITGSFSAEAKPGDPRKTPDSTTATNGSVVYSTSYTPGSVINVKANGGNAVHSQAGNGGGGRVLIVVGGNPVRNGAKRITVTVTWPENGIATPKSYILKTILQDLKDY